jgi:hypothetical protein
MSASAKIRNTLGGSPVSPHMSKSDFLPFLTVSKPKSFANLNPELKFISQNDQWVHECL